MATRRRGGGSAVHLPDFVMYSSDNRCQRLPSQESFAVDKVPGRALRRSVEGLLLGRFERWPAPVPTDGTGPLGLERLEHAEGLLGASAHVQVADRRVPHEAFWVDDERRPRRRTVLPEDAVVERQRPRRVGDDRKRDVAQQRVRLEPRLVAPVAVRARRDENGSPAANPDWSSPNPSAPSGRRTRSRVRRRRGRPTSHEPRATVALECRALRSWRSGDVRVRVERGGRSSDAYCHTSLLLGFRSRDPARTGRRVPGPPHGGRVRHRGVCNGPGARTALDRPAAARLRGADDPRR